MDSFDLSEQRIVQLEQIPLEIRQQIERGDASEYALDLSLNRLRSIDQIGVFDHVVQLDLSGNQLESVNGIQSLRRLQSLDLSRNCIASVDLLALLPALQMLKVAENSLTTIDSLQLLPELRVLDASYNRITKWPPLAGSSLLETLDLSDNMLAAFSSSFSPTLFPARLHRLSIARNQIEKLCGISCLGLQLSGLEFLAFDGNPIVLEVVRCGGQLERLIATFFPSLPLSNDGGLTMSSRRHDEFATAPHTVNYLKRVILEGDEAVLGEFLVTGSTSAQGNVGGFEVLPPPAPTVERPLRRQTSFTGAGDEQGAVGNLLSHDNKLEIWKRIQEDRKTQLGLSNGFGQSSSGMKLEKSVRWGEESVVNAPLEDDTRKAALTTADLAVPDKPQRIAQALDASSLSVMTPLETSTFADTSESVKSFLLPPSGAEYEVIVKKLTDQVTTMRKYMKVWIKREKMVRDASARKIQKWFRRQQRRYHLRQRVLRSRIRRQEQYSFRHCSSSSLQNTNYRGVTKARMEAASAQTVQSLARGFITRRRVALFKKKYTAAYRIQDAWRKTVRDRQTILRGDWKLSGANKGTTNCLDKVRWHGILRGMIRCSHDVKQLQQVCAVQDDAIKYLWNNQVCSNPVDKANLTEKDGNSSPDMYPASMVDEMKSQIDRQSLEIGKMKQQLEALQNLVVNLTATKFENVNEEPQVFLGFSFSNFLRLKQHKFYTQASDMGNVVSCRKSNSQTDACKTPNDGEEHAPKSDPSYEVQEEEVNRSVNNDENTKEVALNQVPMASPKASGGKKTLTPATPLLHGKSGEGGNYSGEH